MIFNTLSTLVIGIIGGIASSLIVSRVMFILSEHQNQIKFVERIIRKVGYISGFMQSAEAILKVSYDHNVQMEKEMKEKGYHTEKEYYIAHSDVDWISKKDVLKVFQKEISKVIESIHEDLTNNPVEDAQLNMLIRDIISYIHDISSIKEYTFSQISQFKKVEQDLLKRYDNCIHMSGKRLICLVIKDRVMISMFFIIGVLSVGTVFAYFMRI